LDVHSRLDLFKLLLKHFIFWTFLKSKHLGAIWIGSEHLHGQELRWRTWPVHIWLHEKILSECHSLLFIFNLLRHGCHSPLLLFTRSFHLSFYLLCCISLLSLFSVVLIQPQSPKLRCRISKKLLHFSFIRKHLFIHRHNTWRATHQIPFLSTYTRFKTFQLLFFHHVLLHSLVQEL